MKSLEITSVAPDAGAEWRDPGEPSAVMGNLATVSRREGLDPLAERLLELRTWLAEDLVGLEAEIDAMDAARAPDLATKAARHLLERPGKRIRPLCVMLSARLGGRRCDDVVRDLAVSAELVHAATLLHDDVIDEGDERRGAAAARRIYGNSASILAGDHLLIEALRRVRGTGEDTALGELIDVIGEMVAAEAVQLERRAAFTPERGSYLDVIHGKTAALFRWGLAAGGRAAGLDADALAALQKAGVALGMAFQLVDDVLDLTGDPTVTGKSALTDLREGKLTWPFIIACEREPALRAHLAALISTPESEWAAGAVGEVVERVLATGAVEETRRFAAQQGEIAREALSPLAPGRARDALELVVEAAVRRAA
jgi:octaprenyl-diphosphate synthase